MHPERHSGIPPRSARTPTALVALACIVASLALGGCATSGGNAAGGALARGGSADRDVAIELAAVLARAYPPLKTTIQINRAADDPSLERLVDALAGRGFGIQRVSADQGAHYLAFSRDVRSAIDGDVSLITWRLAVGELEARRAYALGRDGRLVTAGPLALIGTTTAIGADALADSPVALALPAHDRVIRVEVPNVAEPSTPADAWVAVEPVAAAADGPNGEATDETTDRATNEAFPGHRLVARRAIAFAVGSTTLGESGHRALDTFVDTEGHAGDRAGVLGCSDEANVLALGRTRAVARALVARGLVAVGRYGEPCRARLPGAGPEERAADDVLVELWRRNA